MSRGPTLNDFGVRGTAASELKREVRKLMTEIIGDQLYHAEVVAAGEFHWRAVFVKGMASQFKNNRSGCDELANVVFRFLRGAWRAKYPDISAPAFLNVVAIKTPPTEREIEDAWELEIASDDRSMAKHYEGSARLRRGADIWQGMTKNQRPS